MWVEPFMSYKLTIRIHGEAAKLKSFSLRHVKERAFPGDNLAEWRRKKQ